MSSGSLCSFATLAAILLLSSTGCGVRVIADCRVTPDPSQWPRLDGPRYLIVGSDPQFEASLAFQETAGLLQATLEAEHPDLHRVIAHPTAVPAAPAIRSLPGKPTPSNDPDLVISMQFGVADLGSAVHAYPTYRSYRVYRRGPYGRSYGYGGYYGGTQVQTVHMGFSHNLSLSVWSPDASQPAGRRTLWEGSFSTADDDPDMRTTMPYLCVAAARFYGQSTGGRDSMRIKKKELPVRDALRFATSAPSTACSP